jgi:hypothetical protein
VLISFPEADSAGNAWKVIQQVRGLITKPTSAFATTTHEAAEVVILIVVLEVATLTE